MTTPPSISAALSRLWHTRLQHLVLALLMVTMVGCETLDCQGLVPSYSDVFLETYAERDCNVIGDLFSTRCPNCQLLPLNNGSFAWGEGTARAPWQGDPAIVVEGVTEGITPCIFNRMLRFEASEVNRPTEDDIASTTFQLIDLRQTPLVEDVTFFARALVNRRQVDNETDRTFRLSLTAYAGDPATFTPASTDHQQLGGTTESLIADAETDTWETLFTELRIRSSDIDFLLVAIAAVEDVVDDRGSTTEFDAHFADLVRVGYTGVPHDLGLTFRVLPTTVSQGSQVVFELTLTNHTPNFLFRGAGVATEIRQRTQFSVTNQSTGSVSHLSLRYAEHTGDGTYDPVYGTWDIDRLAGGESANLYIAMQATEVQAGGFGPWKTTATIIDSPNDQTLINNQRTVALSASALSTIAPALALSDTSMVVGDTLSILLFEDVIPPTISTTRSHPEVASVGIGEEVLGTGPETRYYLKVIGKMSGESSIVVVVTSPTRGATADFFNLTVNAPPIAKDDIYTVEAGQSLTVDAPGVLANDSDPEGEMLAAVLETPPATGTLTLNADGSFTYMPDAGFAGDTFTYYAEEAAGQRLRSTIATVTLAFTQPNRPPVAVADNFDVVAGTPTELDLLANDSDPDGDPIQILAVGQPLNGTAEITNDSLAVRYTPAVGFTGTESFSYIIIDEHGAGSFEAIVTVNVATANRTPTVSNAINDITVNVDPPESCSFDLDGHFSDPDGDALTYTHTRSSNAATVAINGSTITVTGSFSSQSTVTVTAQDPGGESVSDTFSVNVQFGTTACGGNNLTQ